MFDQEFSIENLRKLIKRENRKGRYIVSSYLPDVSSSYDKKIKAQNGKKNKLLKHISNEQEKAEREERNEPDKELRAEMKLKATENINELKGELERLEKAIDDLRKGRDDDIDEGLREIIRTTEAKDFKVELFIRASNDPEKPHYVLDDIITRHDMGDRYAYGYGQRTDDKTGYCFSVRRLQLYIKILCKIKHKKAVESLTSYLFFCITIY